MYDAAFKIIRFNPRATVGSAVLVAAIAMAIPVLATAALGAALDLSSTGDLFSDDGQRCDDHATRTSPASPGSSARWCSAACSRASA